MSYCIDDNGFKLSKQNGEGFYVAFIPFNEEDVEEPLFMQVCTNVLQ